MATIRVGGETIRATGGYPFWVIAGEGLADRPAPGRIEAHEPGGVQPGRWVLAVDLRAGDEVLRRDGRASVLDAVAVAECEEAVYNFRVWELENYAVGACGVLVHNTNTGNPNPSSAFPDDPHILTDRLGVPPSKVSTTPDGTPRFVWQPNENTRIRFESHPEGLSPGDAGFNPRHHGPHYHVETKPPGAGWRQSTKVHPPGYTTGSGTGFLPGEPFPGL